MNAEHKWIRLQEIGLVQFLALPIAILIGVMLKNGILLGMLVLALLSGGYCCFRIGYEKRLEIQEQEETTQKYSF